jgi:CRP-like cAMP-binding protein
MGTQDASWLRHEWIGPGMVLIEQGGRDGRLYILREGTLEVVRDGTVVAELTAPGSVVGEMSVLLDQPQTATVRAVTEATYLVVDDAIGVLRAHPEWLLQIARLLAQRVNATTARLTQAEGAHGHLVLPPQFLSALGDPAV